MTNIPHWSLSQLTDPNFREELTLHACDLKGHVILEFTDGKLEVSARMAFLNLFWLDIITEFGIPLCKRHFIRKFRPNNSGLMNAWTNYYDEIMELDPHNAKRLKNVLWDRLYRLYSLSSFNLLSYTQTLDILDLSDIMTDPKVQSMLDDKVKMIVPNRDTRIVEKYIDSRNKELLELFNSKDALQHNALYPYRKADQLNKFQLPQMIFAYGPRTDVDDTVVGLPVAGSAVEGLHNIQEFAVESLSAKKAAFYNHTAVKDSQYFGRRQHLLASSIAHIYPGDCGSTHLIKFTVTEKNYNNIVGKNIMRNGKLVTVTRTMCKELIGQTIEMRSPLTCRYRRGVCEVCGGAVFRNINPKLNLGILSAIHVIEPTTQKILSSKHLIKTFSLVYEIPSSATEVLRKSSANEITWTPELDKMVTKMELGIDVKDFPRFHDTIYLRQEEGKPIKEELFSKIKSITFHNLTTDETVAYDLCAGTASSQLPYFSAEFLLHVRDMYAANRIKLKDGMYWIPLQGTAKMPIFRFVVVNDNMLMFVKRVSRFLNIDIKDFTSCSTALQTMSDIIHDKVEANLVHLEVLLKGYLITSPTDYRVPRVEDPEHVLFEKNASILANRTVGTQLGFEKLEQYLKYPAAYLSCKMSSAFDLFVGLIDDENNK